VSEPALRIVDEEQNEVGLDSADATALLAATAGLEGATVSACPDCHSRVLAAVALVDLVDASPPFPLYVIDDESECRHRSWLDPLYAEWIDVVDDAAGPPVR
jgi:hypothetical protein